MEENELANLLTRTTLNCSDTSSGKKFCSSTNKDNYLSPERIVYELSADATLQFETGGIINVNKTMLAFHSPVFAEIFFGSSPKTNVLVKEFDCETFQTFLDHLFCLKEYTAVDASLIYPIAEKYQVKKSLKDRVYKLTPHSLTEMDENVCLTLNLALLYNISVVADSVMTFFKDTFGIVNLFEREDYFFLFEPISVLKVIENVRMNSFVVEVIYKWGLNCLEKKHKMTNIYSFFEENKILEKISLSSFESVNSILKFHEVSKEKLFTSDEITIHINNALSNSPRCFPLNSEWVKIKKGDKFNERISFKQPFNIVKPAGASYLELGVWFNNMFYEFVKNKNGEVSKAVIYKISYSFTEQSCEFNIDEYNYAIKKECETFFEISNEIPKDKTPCWFDIESSAACIISLDFQYIFNVDCRILKTSFLNNTLFDVEDKNLYFVCDIEMDYE